MFGKATLSLSCLSVAVYTSWQFGNLDKTWARFLADNFTLAEATTMQSRKVQTVLLYPLCHSSLIHLLSNLSVYLTIGNVLERLDGPGSLAKLGLIAAPLGFVLTYTLRNSSNTATTPLQSTRGGGCLSAAMATYYTASYPKQEFSVRGVRVKGWMLAGVLLAGECVVSYCWAGNSSLDAELGGALAAAYFVWMRRMLLRR